MNKTKQFALNKLFNICIVLGSFFAWGSIIWVFRENDIAWGFGFGIVALLLIAVL